MASNAEAALEIFKKNLGTDEGVGSLRFIRYDRDAPAARTQEVGQCETMTQEEFRGIRQEKY